MHRLSAFIVLLAMIVFGSATAGAQDVQLPGGRFFDDNETVHEPNIEAIGALSITVGCVVEGTAYCPEREVTRAQMATFLARALHLDPLPSIFDDVDPSSSHAGNIAAIHERGVTLGCDNTGNRYCPNDPVTREQMASFLVRAFELAPRSTGPFGDISGTHLANINAIAAAEITLGCNAAGTLFCPSRRVTRAQMASFISRGLGLEPVVLLPRLQLTDVQSVCTGATPVCSGTSGSATTGAFYIQEGWFYNLPYSSGDNTRFNAAEFRLFIDGAEITDLVRVPTTDLFGTMVALDGYLVTGLTTGAHTLAGEWWWNGEAAFTSVVVVTVAG